jgi:hypothetical protein
MMDTSLMGWPSVVASNWKSAAHTRLGASAVGVSIVVDVPRRLRRRRRGLVSLTGTVLPRHPAGEPFTDPQHPLEMPNGRAPAFRA